MHIAQIIDTLWIGGAQQLQVTLASASREHGIRLSVVGLRHGNNTPIPQQLQELGVQVLMMPSRRRLDPGRIWQLAQVLRREQCDVVHTHLRTANIIGTLAGRLAGLPVVATLHNTVNTKRPHHTLFQQLETWALRYGAHRVVGVGQHVADTHRQRLHGKPIVSIPNVVLPGSPLASDERLMIRRQMIGDACRPLLMSVGRLTEQKGYGDLLVALDALRQTHPTVATVIVGGGSTHAELAAQIKTLKLEDHVILLGPRHDVPRLLAAADAYVSASLWEGLPVAVLEAMAAALPIVATTVGELPQVIVEGAGILVPPGAPAQLTAALRSLLDNPHGMRALGVAAQAHVTHNYGPTAWMAQLLKLYDEVCARPVHPLRIGGKR